MLSSVPSFSIVCSVYDGRCIVMSRAMMDSSGNGGNLNAALISLIQVGLIRKWALAKKIYMSDSYDSFPQFREPPKRASLWSSEWQTVKLDHWQ